MSDLVTHWVGAFSFDPANTFPHQGNNLVFKRIGGLPDPRYAKMLVVLQRGWKFNPASLSFPCKIEILHGKGLFYKGGVDVEYNTTTKAAFDIEANQSWAFTKVLEETLYSIRWPAGREKSFPYASQ